MDHPSQSASGAKHREERHGGGSEETGGGGGGTQLSRVTWRNSTLAHTLRKHQGPHASPEEDQDTCAPAGK